MASSVRYSKPSLNLLYLFIGGLLVWKVGKILNFWEDSFGSKIDANNEAGILRMNDKMQRIKQYYAASLPQSSAVYDAVALSIYQILSKATSPWSVLYNGPWTAYDILADRITMVGHYSAIELAYIYASFGIRREDNLINEDYYFDMFQYFVSSMKTSEDKEKIRVALKHTYQFVNLKV